ncbi:unnamed protein product [Bemisia tabaci]|uniref:CUE domain-containing protein n=1 Tax=Bemisia tabaci TaxID=7038 RepID=A0A9P0F7H0_BEMTA|nr:PREDICTED: ancient ubiquitous protein 1-like [Bemisia tabaci]CAH0395263.1 unnamed protein product [Bemisia tabaci]
MSTASIFIGSLFDRSRFSQNAVQNTLLGIYFPFGVFLAIVRAFITLQVFVAAFLLPPMTYIRSICFRILFAVLGFCTQKDESSEERDETAPVIVANHVSKFDCIPFHILTGCISPSVWELPSPLSFILGLSRSKSKPKTNGEMVSFLRSHISESKIPVVLFPEEETTNGRAGLLKFSDWSMTLSDRIQPAVIHAWRPWFVQTNISHLGASWYSDLFWFLLTPWTAFSIRYLPTIERNTDETDEALAKRLQKSIADSLNISVTNYSAKDKREYEKRYLLELNAPTVVRNRPDVSAEVLQKAYQVVQVLPHVPLDIAVKQLLKNHKNVDMTISSILEDPSIAPSASGDSGNNSVNKQKIISKEPQNQNASIFSSSPQSRMTAFQERKAALIAEARQKYIEKHGLKLE